ncbi:MAG: hypothetical protein ACXVDZ_09615 [Bacteroidia bacterium]
MNKSYVFFIVLLSLSKTFVAQQDNLHEKKSVECLLSVSSFQPITTSISYKRQIKNQTFFKIGLIDLNFSNNDNKYVNTLAENTSLTINGGLLAGIEFRKSLNDVFTLFHGPGLGCSYLYAKSITTQTNTNEPYVITNKITPEAVYSVGIMAKLSEHFYFAAELNPSVSYSFSYIDFKHSPVNNYKSTATNINFGNKNATLALVYKIR